MLRKNTHREGMALITVLSILIILLIISLAIVCLSTGNLAITSNVTSRLQALNLANSVVMYAIYEIQDTCDPNIYCWGPGSPPPASAGISFQVYDPIPSAKLNNLPGRASVAYAA